MIGKTLSHYKILSKLGEGGMGVVYKAHDIQLDRDVALKFLPHSLTSDPNEKERFYHEARAASALNHPGITTIYEISEHEGQLFIAMELVEGQTLKRLIESGPLGIGKVIDIAIQVAEGLSIAHEKGIVHRDIKSENIMLTPRDQAKIMDFGLAKVKGATKLTKTGSTLGTAAYMSPEQAQGGEVDHRSDIFSFGVVLFELLTGKLPFKGEHIPALVYSIVNDEPPPLARFNEKAGNEVQRLVSKALIKDRQERYQHVDEMLADLKVLKRTGEPREGKVLSKRVKPGQKRSWRLYAGILLILGILASFMVYRVLLKQESLDSLAVLPLQNLTGDEEQEYFSDGMTEALIAELQKIKALRVISRTSVMGYKKTEKRLPQIAKELNVKALVEGSVLREGDMVRITVQLIQASPEKHLWAKPYDREMKNILLLQSDVAQAIAREINVLVTPEERMRLSTSRMVNVEAHEAYLKGRYHWNKRTASDLQKAIDYFIQAIETDSDYALAYAGLAQTYAILPEYALLSSKEWMPKSEAMARKALDLDPDLAEAHAVLGAINEAFKWDWAEAEKEYLKAIELNPNYAMTYHWYGGYLRNYGRFNEALEQVRKAQELDPLSLIINVNAGCVYYYMRRYDEAIVEFKKVIDLDQNFLVAHVFLGLAQCMKYNYSEAIEELEKMRVTVGNTFYGLPELGYVYARAGRVREAKSVLDELLRAARQGYTIFYGLALVNNGLGDKDKSLDWLEKAYEERDGWTSGLKVDPLFDNLRSEIRFKDIMKKIGLDE